MNPSVIHVMHVVHRLTTGGAEKVLVNLINGSGPEFFHHVVSFCPPDDFAETITSDRCRIWSLGKSEGNDLTLPFKIRRIIRQNDISVVHAQGWGVYAESLCAARFLGRKVPFVFAFRGKTIADTHGIPWRRRIAQRIFSRWCESIITPSNLMRCEYSQDIEIPQERIQVIYNGVDEHLFGGIGSLPPSESPVIGCVARLDAVKGVDMLIDAVGLLRQEGFNIRLKVIGDGDERGRLEGQIESLGLSDHVDLSGWSRNVDVEMAGFDLYVQPSRYEGVSNAILEAMAAGKAVIATNVGGTPEVITNEIEGLLVEASASGLADGMRRLLSDHKLSDKLRMSARQRAVEDFSLNRMIRNYEDLFVSLSR